MKTGLGKQAFTVVEVMIVLGVSSMLMISGLLLINGQQAKTQGKQALDDIKQQMDTVINNIATGYYPSFDNILCNAPAAGPPSVGVGAAGSNSRGANTGCIFVGEAVQFRLNGVDSDYNVYSLAGRQYRSGTTNEDVHSVADTMPVAHDALIDNKVLQYGMKPVRVKYNDTTNIGTFAIITDFAGLDSNGNLASGSRAAQLYAVTGSALGDSQAAIEGVINNTANLVAANKVTICFDIGLKQYGIITIGSTNNGGTNPRLTTDELIVDQASNPGACT